ncbi:MAG: glycosyltransferase family 2 protein [Ferruginibacter sp.]|nr:glycosyltransferase family 2 protein [Ferruginibacter sp.]
MEKISVIIITKNEERNIAATLDAAWKVADEIIVADSGSVDQTEAICLAKNVQFIKQPWLGFGAQRNAAVLKAANDHILVLDADEVLDNLAIESLLALKATGFQAKVFALKRVNFYFGKFMKHGLEAPELKARLYHRDAARWDDKLVHESLSFDTKLEVGRIDGLLLHYTYRTLEEYLLKSDQYSTLSAQTYFKAGKQDPGIVKLALSPCFTFINAYFLKAGFLDGWHGWIMAKMQASYVLQKYAKLKLLYAAAKERPSH